VDGASSSLQRCGEHSSLGVISGSNRMTATASSKVARGAAWMVFARIADRCIGVASTVILARLLVPADFGLVGMAMAVIGLIELASAFGFEVPLLRAAKPTRAQYDTVWTLDLIFGCGCALGIALAAWPAAAFYKDERLVAVMLVLAVSWAVGGLANVGTVDFRRELNFVKEFQLMMSSRLVSFCVTIPAALLLQSYWALIAGMTAGRLARVLFSYLWHPYRPRLCLQAARELFSFSLWIFVEKLASFGNARLGDFILGRTHGPTELGVYRLGEEIGYLPGSELVAPVNRAFLPGASRLVEGGHSMADVVIRASGIVALFLLPACLGIAAVAEPLVRAMLGTKWLGAIPIVEIMAVNAIFVSLWSTQQTAAFAAGLPKVPALVGIARLGVFLPAVLWAAPLKGAEGLALAATVSSASALMLGLWMSARTLSFGITRWILALWRPLVAAAVMAHVVRLFIAGLAPSTDALSSLLLLLTAVAVGVVTYVALLVFLYFVAGRPQGAERLLLERIWQWMGR